MSSSDRILMGNFKFNKVQSIEKDLHDITLYEFLHVATEPLMHFDKNYVSGAHLRGI